jgi:hypothetical protein
MESKGSLLHLQVPTTFPVLSHIDPVHALASHFLNIHLNIILPYMPGSYKWSLSLRFSHQNLVYTSTVPHTCYMPCPHNLSQFDHLNNIHWEVQIIKLLIMLFSPFPCYLIPLRPNYSPLTQEGSLVVSKHQEPHTFLSVWAVWLVEG